MISTNEGWNAYFADAAMGKMPLYPSLEKLITNNYPPLSFYVVGGFGQLLGDTILSGRLLSLVAVIIITFFIGQIIRHWGGSWQAALVGSLYFLGTMCLSFRWYVGANDPQLLAQAIMVIGFFLFLRAIEKNTHYFLPLTIMVIAGFFKHNIMTLPVSAMIGLILWKRWKELFLCTFFSLFLILTGLMCCYFFYGIDFFHNFLTPRQWLLEKASDSIGDLQSLVMGILIWILVAWKERRQRLVHFITIMMIVALVVGFVQRLGSGVFVNAQFDLIIVVSIAVGFVFQLLSNEKKEWVQTLLLLLLAGSFLFSPNFFSFTYIFSPEARSETREQEQIMNQLIEEVRASPVDVFCESYITYRAGKPFVVDAFNVEERIAAKKLPSDVVDKLIEEGQLVEVKRCWQVGVE
jgi:hypothetical protein